MDTVAELAGETEVLKNALKRLENHGLTATVERNHPALGRTRADALVRLAYGKQRNTLYAVEVKRWVTPANIGAIVTRLRELGPAALLVTDYVTPQVGERLKQLDVAFADAAGNAYLRGPNFLVWLIGQKPREIHKPPRPGRAWQPTGLKVIFALLCHPDWIALGYRELAARAGVANGTVGWVMRDLQEMRYLTVVKRTRRLNATKRMLDEWALAYARTLRPRLLIGRYQAPTLQDWKEWHPEKEGALWGGEPAAALLTEYLRPGVLTLYAKQVPGRLVLDHKLTAAPNHLVKEHVVDFRQRFWDFDVAADKPHTVPPALVYADLLATGDARCIETARKLYDGNLDRLFAEN
jgi:hypothetical protein